MQRSDSVQKKVGVAVVFVAAVTLQSTDAYAAAMPINGSCSTHNVTPEASNESGRRKCAASPPAHASSQSVIRAWCADGSVKKLAAQRYTCVLLFLLGRSHLGATKNALSYCTQRDRNTQPTRSEGASLRDRVGWSSVHARTFLRQRRPRE